ncbi:hypothetical protein NLG97_g9535 [Lecanicillium saksenae]|uniref:Uncharacterized protein n=1 Tax=Lecanicillium saksenae TaxID=468837 RepID=A0ACC1QI89_9HYPO|nr:hypothetical protein NLG97_g9535 [Lecanicillium saksenae]
MAAAGGEPEEAPVGAGGLDPGCAGGGPYRDADAEGGAVVLAGVPLLAVGDCWGCAVAVGALAAVMGLELNVCTGAIVFYTKLVAESG